MDRVQGTVSWSLRSRNAGVGSPGMRGEAQRMERAGRNGSVLWLLSPSPSSSQINEEGKLQYSNSLHGSVARGEWKQQREECYTSRNEKGAQKFVPTATKMQPAPQQNQAALDYNGNTTQETRGQLPRWSNFVSPKLGIRAEHERSFSTNQHTPTASAPGALLLPGGNHQGSFCLSLKWELN